MTPTPDRTRVQAQITARGADGRVVMRLHRDSTHFDAETLLSVEVEQRWFAPPDGTLEIEALDAEEAEATV